MTANHHPLPVNREEQTSKPLERELSEAFLAGDEMAAQELYEKYHRLIAHIARKAIPRLHNGSVDEDDLVQAGWEHALTRIRRSDDDEIKQYPLSTVLTGFLFEAVSSTVVDQQYAVRLPKDVSNVLNRIQAINTERMNANKPVMDEKEIEEEFGISYGRVYESGKTTGAIMRAVRLTRLMGSTDRGFSSDADFSLGDGYVLDEVNAMTRVDGEPDVAVDEQASKEAMRKHVREVVGRAPLTYRQRQALELRFGMASDDGREMSLDEVGRELGVTTGRASQLVLRALEILREHRHTYDTLSA